MDAIEGITLACREIIPNQSGDSLYIRPIMIATEESLGIRPSTKYKFIVMASPSGSYFSGGPLKVLVEREFTRASAGGTGNAKTGGNYAKSMQANLKAKELNLDQTLWLDSQDKTLIEELSGMNFFAVINGVLVTPQTSDTILDGITRKSLIEIAKKLNIPFEIQKIKINELYNKIESGECSELFSCGTAAIITPIASLHEENGKIYSPKHDFGPIAQKLRFELLGIQEGQIEDTFNWTVNLSAKTLDL